MSQHDFIGVRARAENLLKAFETGAIGQSGFSARFRVIGGQVLKLHEIKRPEYNTYTAWKKEVDKKLGQLVQVEAAKFTSANVDRRSAGHFLWYGINQKLKSLAEYMLEFDLSHQKKMSLGELLSMFFAVSPGCDLSEVEGGVDVPREFVEYKRKIASGAEKDWSGYLNASGTKGQDYVARVYFLSAGIEFCRSAHDVEAALEVLRHAVSKRVNPIGQRNLQILWDAFTSDCTELMRKSAIELRVELAPLCGKLKNAAELAADRIQALTPKKSRYPKDEFPDAALLVREAQRLYHADLAHQEEVRQANLPYQADLARLEEIPRQEDGSPPLTRENIARPRPWELSLPHARKILNHRQRRIYSDVY